MAISFNSVPSSLLVPFVAVEFDTSRAAQGSGDLAYAALIIAPRLATGAAAANSLTRITSVEQAIVAAGRGSVAHRMALAWRASNRSTPLYLGLVDDQIAGNQASCTITVTGPAAAAGVIPLYLGGVRIDVAIAYNRSASEIAGDIVAAVNAATDLPVSASAVAAVVTLTFRHKGTIGNGYSVLWSYLDGDALPTGVTLAITAMAGGTTVPLLDTLLATIGDLWFQVVAHPYTDSTSLSAIETEMASRFGPTRAIPGVAITATSGTLSTITTLTSARNSPHSTIWAPPGAAPLTPTFELAAESAALVALYGQIDPGRPFQTIALTNARPTAATDQWSVDERDVLLHAGAATMINAAGGTVQLERAITTYRTSPAGSPDPTYRDVTTMLTLLYYRYSFVSRMRLRYPRHKLASDGTRFGSGQAVITPQIGKAEALMWFRDMESRGLVEGYDQFRADLIVERNAGNANRLDFLLPADVINQLISVGVQFQPRL